MAKHDELVCTSYLSRAAVATAEDRLFNPRLLQSAYRSGLGQATEPQIAPEGIAIGVSVCVNKLD